MNSRAEQNQTVLLSPLPLQMEEAIVALEQSSYPSDEAASRERIHMRLTGASEFFQGAFLPDNTWVGFLNATLSRKSTLDHESMFCHEPDGQHLCIHSVVVKPEFRRRGVGTAMMKEYVRQIQRRSPPILELVLICKPHMVKLYLDAGFRDCGKSRIEYGSSGWIEMRHSLLLE